LLLKQLMMVEAVRGLRMLLLLLLLLLLLGGWRGHAGISWQSAAMAGFLPVSYLFILCVLITVWQ